MNGKGGLMVKIEMLREELEKVRTAKTNYEYLQAHTISETAREIYAIEIAEYASKIRIKEAKIRNLEKDLEKYH